MPRVRLCSALRTPLARFRTPAASTWHGVLLSVAIAVVPSTTTANPIPPSAVLVHVQPVDSNWCELNRVASCAEIVQSTDVSGPLEFDLFLYDPIAMGGRCLDRLSTVVEWSERWQVVHWEICHGGEGTVEIDGNEASLDLSWPGGEPMTTEVLLAARFFVLVDGPGYLGQVDPVVGEAVLRSWPAGPPIALSPKQCAAEAGSACNNCYTSCDLQLLCRPMADPSEIDIVLVEGESTRAEVEVRLRGWYGCGPMTFVTTAAWLTAIPQLVSSGTWRVVLDIDASALRPGEYTGYLRAENACVGCAQLNLRVTPIPSPVVSSTWGHIKTLHP